MIHTIPVQPGEIRLGEPLPWDVFDTNRQLLLSKGHVVTRESQLQVLMARGVHFDLRGLSRPATRHVAPPAFDPFRLWDYILDELEVLLTNLRLEPEFLAQMTGLARLVLKLAERSPDSALAAMILTDQRRYPIVHSLHTAILCELTARRMNWDDERRVSLCCAAMSMNVAMLELQQLLCAQRVAPTPDQRKAIHRHPSLGETLLRDAGVEDPVWLSAVRDHHERIGGGGYPFGITRPDDEALLIQTADTFSAKVSPRAARPPTTAQEAARSLFVESDSGNRNPFAAALIKEIGIFPPGTCVQLANGETGIVVQRGQAANAPRVMSLLDTNGLSYRRPIRRDTADAIFAIRAVVPREKQRININPQTLWGSAP